MAQGSPKAPPTPEEYESLYRRYRELAKQVDHLSTLREIGLAISGTLELSETLPLIANVVQGALGVQRLTILELGQQRQVLQPVIAKYGSDLIQRSRLAEEHTPRRGTPEGRALDSHTVVLEADAARRTAYVPLVAKDTPLGVMVLEDQGEGQPFSADDAELFRQLGTQVALAIHNGQLYAMAVTDGLTGLFVRRYFDLQLEDGFAKARRYGQGFSLLLIDIDHFKHLNDTWGHQTGDRVLQEMAILFQQNTRETDICCRYGGEELAVILPSTEVEEAALLANKLGTLVRRHTFTGNDDESLNVTVSIGVAAYGEDSEGPSDLIAAADEALYEAKRLGRNRVEVAGVA